jgi:hypothetical protein
MSDDTDVVRAWHLAGDHVCSCRWPAPRRLGAFDVSECSDCERVIMPMDTAAELVERLMHAGVIAP